jgi:hypothetical protein
MSTVPAVTMQDLELEHAELLPRRETLWTHSSPTVNLTNVVGSGNGNGNGNHDGNGVFNVLSGNGDGNLNGVGNGDGNLIIG